MAKKGRSRKNYSRYKKCPEPLNRMIDLAAVATIGYLSSNKRKKRNQNNYKTRSNYSNNYYRNTYSGTQSASLRIDPYKATGAAMGLGLINDTEDFLEFGAVLGAMGAFDEPDNYIEDSIYEQEEDLLPISFTELDNSDAWRLNCENGSLYGISPYEYSSREDYYLALNNAKAGSSSNSNLAPENDDLQNQNNSKNTKGFLDLKEFIFCLVSRLDNGKSQYYLAKNDSVKVGDVVRVPVKNSETTQGVILSVEKYTRLTAPQKPEELGWII